MSLEMDAVKVEEDQSELLACRICLAWDVKLYHIIESGLDKTFLELMGTAVVASDGLPQHLCSWCRALLLKAVTLRERSQRAEALLRLVLPRQVITNPYIRTINRPAHKLTHTLSQNLNTNIQYFYEVDDTLTNLKYPVIKVEIEPCENEFNSEDDEDDDYYDKAEDMLLIVADHSDDSDEDSKMNLQEYKYKVENDNIEAKPMLSEVEILEANTDTELNGISKRCLKEVNKVKLRNKKRDSKVKKKTKEETDVKTGSVKEKDNSELGIEEFIQKYNFEIEYLTEEEMVADMESRKVSDRYKNCKFKCKLCYKGFLTSATFDKHVETNHNPRNVNNECRLCRMNFRQGRHLKPHVESAHRLRLRCVECGTAVFGRKECIAHAAHHAGRQCKHCGKSYANHSTYAWHLRAAHPVENNEQGSCELCGEIYTSAKGLRAHKLFTHGKQATSELQCRRCRTQFDNERALRTHQQQQDGKCDLNLSACASCGAGLQGSEALLRHMHDDHQVHIYTCDQCDKSFLSKTSLCTHIDRAHRGIRPPQQPNNKPKKRVPYRELERKYICEQCGKAYAFRAFLKYHQMTHTDERAFKCNRCPKRFTTAQQLTRHTKTHAGERPFKCDQCHLAFTAQFNMIRHQKSVHMGEKPYKCTICSKAFAQSNSVRSHIKYVHMKVKAPPRKRNKINKN